MTIPEHNITIYKGTTFRKTITWMQSNNQPVDLTSCSAKMQVKDATGEVIVELTSSLGGGITLGGVAGTIELVITNIVTATMTSGKYDLNITLSNGDVIKLLKGTFSLLDGITI